MKNGLLVVAVAGLCFVACKKKDAASSTETGSAAAVAAPAAKTGEPASAPAAAGKAKSCEERGGTKNAIGRCMVKTAAPVDSSFTGRFDTDMMHPDPGAVFKVTNKLAVPIKVHTAQLYAYDKAGKQLDIDINGSKAKYSQDSQTDLVELGPNETKEFVDSLGKKSFAPEMDTLQIEVPAWSEDGMEFEHALPDDNARPKDGWK
jgi:hypothetical protein